MSIKSLAEFSKSGGLRRGVLQLEDGAQVLVQELSLAQRDVFMALQNDTNVTPNRIPAMIACMVVIDEAGTRILEGQEDAVLDMIRPDLLKQVVDKALEVSGLTGGEEGKNPTA